MSFVPKPTKVILLYQFKNWRENRIFQQFLSVAKSKLPPLFELMLFYIVPQSRKFTLIIKSDAQPLLPEKLVGYCRQCLAQFSPLNDIW